MTVSYDRQATSVSQFAAGLTQSDNQIMDGGSSDQCVLSSVQSMIKQGVKYVNTPIMAWGLPDPWPDPSTPGPTDWDSLDARVQLVQRLGETPVITLAEAPWWMKGMYVGHGKTQPLTADQEWQVEAYESRILDNKMDAWTHLVQAVAQRYMRPPYNVRYFQVWNELKGYYDPDINNYDFTTSAGNPDGPNARHGYTYMYNQVYTTLMNVASSLHVSQQEVNVGGPYVVMDTWSSNAQQSHPSRLVKPYGVFDQRSLNVVQYWLQHKAGAGFITFDASLENRDTGKILNQQPFVSASIFADTVRWIRSLNPTLYPGANTLPIWLAEWYSWTETDNTSLQEDNALKTVTMLQFIEAGGGIALSWNNFGNGGSDYGLWSPTQKAGREQANPWYDSYKALTENFGSGTTLYRTTVSDPGSVAALASQKQLLLVNQTASSVQVHVNNSTIALSPYQVSFTALK
ncbi:hypothetical protein [Dictyobacter aurantiacus]|uniref:D-apionate lactonase C-terminal domain-containing protein n=1 Tax=Dictyobacter aurantiacus TaxID=1936993 RepID=A0A401Z7C2_9CHLR|nr:hypothetical protein [Dictyobacter aurantiacus]GCE02770.1 hypothetical protein KDAU_00990 [Dictyobacter aurantiacus]